MKLFLLSQFLATNNFINTSGRNGKIYRDPDIEEENEKSVKGADDRGARERYRLESIAINAPFPSLEKWYQSACS